MKSKFASSIVAISCLVLAKLALAAQGPTQAPLKVTHMYATGVLYVQFQPGSMPGCYAGAGGYLVTTNPLYKELYALLLTMVATGGIRAAVVYTQNASTNNWGDCTIEGISLIPE